MITPNVTPSYDALHSAWAHNLLNNQQFFTACVVQGILPQRAGNKPKLNDWADAWDAVGYDKFFRPDPQQVNIAALRGFIAPGKEKEVWDCYKMDGRIMPHLVDMYRTWPTVPEAIGLWQKQIVKDREQYHQYMKKAGTPTQQVKTDLEELYRARLTVGDLTTLWNRDAIQEQEWERQVKKTAGYDLETIETMKDLTEGPPGPADLVRFAVREAFDDKQARELGLDSEYEDTGSFEYWMDAQGQGHTKSYERPGDPQVVNWAKLYWRAHWQLMAPTQCYEALHRLRPNRVQLYNDLVPGLEPFTIDTLNSLLKANDYVPKQRQWLAAISYAVPEARLTRQLYDFDLIKRDDFIEMLMDRGIIRADAERLAKLEDVKKPYLQKKYLVPPLDSYDKAVYREVLSAYRTGNISESVLRGQLESILINSDVVNKVVASETIRRNNEITKQYIKSVRQALFLGEVSLQGAEQLLYNGGIAGDMIAKYATLWAAQLTLPRKTASAGQLVTWYRNYFIGRQDFFDRMIRLGFSGDHIVFALADADRLRAEDEMKQQQATARANKQAAKEAKQHKKELQSEQNRFRSPAVIKRWYAEGSIGIQDVVELLTEIGTPQADMDRWIADITGE